MVISEDGFGLSNFHVVAEFMDTRKGVGGLSDGKLYPLEVLGIDPTGDVAMFKLSGKDKFTPAVLGDADTVEIVLNLRPDELGRHSGPVSIPDAEPIMLTKFTYP